MARIPGIAGGRHWWQRDLLLEAVEFVPPVIVLVLAAYEDTSSGKFCVLLGIAAWLAIPGAIKLLRASQRDREATGKQKLHELFGCLWVLHRVVSKHLDADGDDGTLRITLHKVVYAPGPEGKQKQLQQVVPYIGGFGKEPGRTWPVETGIIGLCARTGEPLRASLKSDNRKAFIEEMKTDWSYTDDGARELTPDRRAWFAVPIKDVGGHRVLGVVYLDSDVPDAFEDPRFRGFVYGGCRGIGEFVCERYD